MKPILLFIFLYLLQSSISSNLFFKWRITDTERAQVRRESIALLQSNSELYEKFISNYKTRDIKYNYLNKKENSDSSPEEEPTLYLSRYTHCQKCLTFIKSFVKIKEKYGFKNFYDNLKNEVCNLLDSINYIAADACTSIVDSYVPIAVERAFNRYIDSYFICEKIDLCPSEIPKKYSNPDDYARKILTEKKNVIRKDEKIEPDGKKIKILQITDLHLDLKYKEGATGKCKYPICCRDLPTEEEKAKNVDLCGKYGYEGQTDISQDLFESFIEDASKKDFDMIIWTGDNGPHDVWSSDQEKFNEISKLIKNRIDEALRGKKKEIPVFVCLGNHEKVPNDAYKEDNFSDEKNLLEQFGEIYKDYITDSQALADFKKYGYYSMNYDEKLKIISLNCFLCDGFNFNLFNSTKEQTKQMFKWLEKELEKAEKNEEFVYIINHFPLNGEFTLSECGKRFNALFDRYENIIRGIFSGHTHRDDIEGITEYFNKDNIILLNFVAPQLTTYEYKLPSYRIYTVDDSTKRVLDYEQFRFNLTKSNEEKKPYWFSAYNASKFYGVDNLLDYKKIINFENMGEYVYNQYSGSKVGEQYRNNPDKIKAAKCIMTTNNFDDYFECYHPDIGIRYEYLNLLTNFFIGPFEED